MGGGILTSLQQQVLESIQDACDELSEEDFLLFICWLENRAAAEQEVYHATHPEMGE